MSKNKWFTAKGIYLHEPEYLNAKQWYEERIILLKAKNEDEALRFAKKEAIDYVKDLEGSKFIEITDVHELYDEEISDKCEVFSSKTISLLKPQDYLETFYQNTPEDCETINEKHSWRNLDDENSACYNCLVKRKGRLWETENGKSKQ